MLCRTAQIATLGSSADPVLIGVRGLPVYKLHLIFLEENRRTAEALSGDLCRVLNVEVEELTVSRNAIFDNVLEGVSRILQEGKENFEDFLVNVSSGDKPLDFAALVSAFTNGLKTFTVVDNELFMLPMLKFNYEQSLSKTKLEILRAIMSVGGRVDSLAKLVEVTGYGKPLLSYHILGAADSKGLVRLGLVDVHKGPRGTTVVRETTMGRMLAKGQLEVRSDHSGVAWKARPEMLAQAVPRHRNGLVEIQGTGSVLLDERHGRTLPARPQSRLVPKPSVSACYQFPFLSIVFLTFSSVMIAGSYSTYNLSVIRLTSALWTPSRLDIIFRVSSISTEASLLVIANVALAFFSDILRVDASS